MSSKEIHPSKRPYPLIEGKPQLKNSIVLTADVLGFSDLVMRSYLGNELDHQLNKTWNILTPRVRQLDKWGDSDRDKPYEFRVFTDNVVIGWPILQDGEIEFGFTLISAAHYQLELALDGLLIRGAMDIGPAYIYDYFVFGPPVIMSHLLEIDEAINPR